MTARILEALLLSVIESIDSMEAGHASHCLGGALRDATVPRRTLDADSGMGSRRRERAFRAAGVVCSSSWVISTMAASPRDAAGAVDA